jgi:hypothetical protein
VTIRIFVEGGSQGSTKAGCREGFRKFFEKVIPSRSFAITASGSRSEAFKDFCLTLKQNSGDYNILLVDSEEAVAASPWAHLAAREGDHWKKPEGATDDQAQLMVQVMESWFLADRDALASFYGQGFTPGSLPGQPNVELISKRDVLSALYNASRNTRSKGDFGFGNLFEPKARLSLALD